MACTRHIITIRNLRNESELSMASPPFKSLKCNCHVRLVVFSFKRCTIEPKNSVCLKHLTRMEVFTLQKKFLILSGYARSDTITRARGFVQFLGFFVLIVNLIFESYFVYVNHKDILVSAECFGPLSTEMITIVKMIIVFISKKKFYYLIDEIQKMTIEASEDDKSVLKKANKWDQTIASTLLTTASISAVCLSCGPMILNLINMALFGDEYIREIPIKVEFPFEWRKISPAFELVAASMDYSCYITVMFIVSFPDN